MARDLEQFDPADLDGPAQRPGGAVMVPTRLDLVTVPIPGSPDRSVTALIDMGTAEVFMAIEIPPADLEAALRGAAAFGGAKWLGRRWHFPVEFLKARQPAGAEVYDVVARLVRRAAAYVEMNTVPQPRA